MEEDLKDGRILVDLLNRLEVSNAIQRWNKNPRSKVQCLENIGLALHFCSQQNIKLVNIGELKSGRITKRGELRSKSKNGEGRSTSMKCYLCKFIA